MFNFSSSNRYSTLYQQKTNKKVAAPSRLTKKEKTKIEKQTISYLLLGVVVLLLFVFLVVPNLIKLFFSVTDKEAAVDNKDIVPPQVPILASNPPEATFSASLSLHGFAEPLSKVVFLLDSSKVAEVQASDDGQFEQELALAEGPNELTIFGIDEAGNESLKTRSYAIARDSEVPSLEITDPQDGSVIELKKNRTTVIKGKTEANAKVLINGRLVLADKDGNFSTNYYLAEGKNELKFEATDKATNKAEKTISVEFKL